jgi:hypothetical protein
MNKLRPGDNVRVVYGDESISQMFGDVDSGFETVITDVFDNGCIKVQGSQMAWNRDEIELIQKINIDEEEIMSLF